MANSIVHRLLSLSPSLWKGMGRLVYYRIPNRPIPSTPSSLDADMLALQKDWQAIGNDMRTVGETFESRRRTELTGARRR